MHPLLLLAALLASCVPALIVSSPLGAILAQAMDYSADVDALARQLSIVEVAELLALYRANQSNVQNHVGIAWVCLLITAPGLYALLGAMHRHANMPVQSRLKKAVLDYPRWLFLQLFSFLVWVGFVVLVGVAVLALESYQQQIFSLTRWQIIRAAALVLIVVAALLIHFLQLSARAEYICDETLHFPPLAYLRALRAGRFGSRMLSYLLLGLIALLMLLVLSGLRFIETDQPNFSALIALAHAGLVSIVTGWLNFARILSLSHYASVRVV